MAGNKEVEGPGQVGGFDEGRHPTKKRKRPSNNNGEDNGGVPPARALQLVHQDAQTEGHTAPVGQSPYTQGYRPQDPEEPNYKDVGGGGRKRKTRKGKKKSNAKSKKRVLKKTRSRRKSMKKSRPRRR